MRHKHPNLRKLRRCTSLECKLKYTFPCGRPNNSFTGVYDTKDNSNDVNGSMVIRVGEEYDFLF
jgi:hypothetical protein